MNRICFPYIVSGLMILVGVTLVIVDEAEPGGQAMLIAGIVLISVGAVGVICTIVVHRGFKKTFKKKPVIVRDVSFVGFGRRTVDNVVDLVNSVVDGLHCKASYFARNEDFIPDAHEKKLIFVAAFTERNNIFGSKPDYGELSVVYDMLSDEMKGKVFVIYAGVPSNQYVINENALYPEVFTRMLRHQPAMGELMSREHFVVVNSNYKMNHYQTNVFLKWLVD